MANSTKISEYSTTAANNTSIDSIDIDENCAASGINNALRSVLKHQADAFTQGTPIALDQTNNRVSIGTTSPHTADSLLTLQNGSGVAELNITSGTSGASLINMGDTGDYNIGRIKYDQSTNSMQFNTNNAERMRIDSSGNVGIGTASPSLATASGSANGLEISGSVPAINLNAGSSDEFLIYGGASNANILVANNNPLRIITGGSESLRIDSNGTTTATSNAGHTCFKAYQPTTNSSRSVVQVLSNVTSTGKVHCKILSDGDILNTNNSYGALSDKTLKENVADARSQWADIKAVQVRNYSMIDEKQDAANRIGVIAQELETAGMNGLVRIEEDGLKSVKYSVLYMKAVKALQEAMARIETLETEMTALKARVTALEA